MTYANGTNTKGARVNLYSDMGEAIKSRAIIGGFCTFFGGSIVWTLFIVIILAPLIAKPTIIWVLNLLVAYGLMFRSGMFSAALARTHEHLHAVIVTILAILYSLIWFHRTPTWFWVLYVLFTVPFAILGSQYVLRKRKFNGKTQLLSHIGASNGRR